MEYAKRLTILMLAAALVAGGVARAEHADEPAAEAALVVHVTDLRNGKGHLRLGVFDSPRGFPRDRKHARLWQSLPANAEEKAFTLSLPPGRYAIVVLHDENSNKKLDTNFLGVPKEGYGVSNNPKPPLRAARFSEAVFTLRDDGAEKTISIQYF